ncbi:MAG: ATP-dependent Clp protease adaptor ClpS [Bacteroidota bacterium]|jgi:ATP-dependent Clp protease adaptor protein ClpS
MSKEIRKVEEEVVTLDETTSGLNLIIFNDDVNTFDHVIECLVRICNHDAIQAEQSATIIHYKGKSVVKSGTHDELAAMCQALCDEGLSAVIGE